MNRLEQKKIEFFHHYCPDFDNQSLWRNEKEKKNEKDQTQTTCDASRP